MSNPPNLSLERLHERHSGLTEALGQTYCEAAAVCFARHHQPPLTISVRQGGKDELRTISFPVPDARISNAHANEIDATEAGAYGVSLAAVEAVAGLFAVRRAETLTGADWYVAPAGVSADDLEDCIRLEVSGTSSGGSSEVSRRLQEKIAQTARGKSNLPAMAAVVGFKVLEIAIAPLGAEV